MCFSYTVTAKPTVCVCVCVYGGEGVVLMQNSVKGETSVPSSQNSAYTPSRTTLVRMWWCHILKKNCCHAIMWLCDTRENYATLKLSVVQHVVLMGENSSSRLNGSRFSGWSPQHIDEDPQQQQGYNLWLIFIIEYSMSYFITIQLTVCCSIQPLQ